MFRLSPSLNPKRVFILQKSELEKRWDPKTYHIERRSIIDALKKSGHQLEPLKFVSSFKKNLVREIPENLPYLGLENIESNTGSYIPTSDKESISSAIQFKKGQVLFPKLRPYLNKVYFAEFDGVCSTEFHVLDSKKVSNEYLANFLRTNLVVNQTKYLMSGNTLPRLQTEDIESLLIPILSKTDEEKVNAVMRKAFIQKQKNEAEAEKLLSSIDDYLLKELGIKLPQPPENTLKNRMFMTTLREISGGRLDPNFHKVEFEELISAIKKVSFSNLKRLIAFSNEAWDQISLFSSSFPYIEISEINTTTGEITQIVEVEKDSAPSRARMIVRSGDILISTTRPSRGAITLYLHDSISIASTGFSVIRQKFKEKVNFTYLWFVLRSKISLKQMEQRSSGGNYPAITQEELGNILIPLPPLAKQIEIAEHISGNRQQAQQLKDKTKELLKKASEEIEEILLK